MTSDLSFEQAEAELRTIVERLESGDVAIDEAIALWERGEELYAICRQRLDAAEERAAKKKVKALFHMPGGAPQDFSITGVEIAEAVDALPETAPGTNVIVQSDPSRMFASGIATGVRFEVGERADLTVTV